MKAPGALIRIPITLVGDADPAAFEAALETLAASDPQIEIKRTPVRQRAILGRVSERRLEITAQRLIREYGFQLQFGTPEVAYLETILRTVDQDCTHKRRRYRAVCTDQSAI